jgi:tRNA(Ile)-lysidine synthase TilS/MesJ
MDISKKICSRCILPDTFPGIKFDDKGVCNHCLRDEKAIKKADEKKADYRKRLDELIDNKKDKAPVYDVIIAYSGGKDSSYTLKLLKERYDLRILAYTFDNSFTSPFAFENIKNVADYLKVDHIQFRIPWENVKHLFSLTAKKDVFSKATLLRASSICTTCIGIVKSIVLKTALEMNIPLVAFGWSPGQAPIQSAIMKTNPNLNRQAQAAYLKAFPDETKKMINSYLIPDSYYKIYKDKFPYNIHPLAFFDYNEEEIKRELEFIGWKIPSDTDTNSSNCLLNAYANHCHIERNGLHPYVWEIANMVRQTIIDRDEGIEKIYTEQNKKMVEYVEEKLEL